MVETMRQQAERYLGTAIEPQEWLRAENSAWQKRQYIIGRYGDSGGQRREPWYMAQLIAEAVRSDRLRRLTAQLTDCYMGTKKDSPCPKTQGRPINHPYCRTEVRQMQ